MSIASEIIEDLERCEPKGEDWTPVLERLVGAAASLIVAGPTFLQRNSEGARAYLETRVRLPQLLRASLRAHDRIDFFSNDLKWWSAGYYFNSAVSRLYNAIEKILVLRCGGGHDHGGEGHDHFIRRCATHLMSRLPLPALSVLQDLPARSNCDAVLTELINVLADGTFPAEDLDELRARLDSSDDFLKAALLFCWRDTNVQKHVTGRGRRRHGYIGHDDLAQDPRIQYALALRAFHATCELYRVLQRV